MTRSFILAFVWLVASGVAALACQGQSGRVIFEDTFADDSGGWQLAPPSTQVVPPNFVFTPTQNNLASLTPNLTFNATDGDYCVEFNLPKTTKDGTKSGVGILFWGTDLNNTYMALLTSAPEWDLYKRVSGNWNLISSVSALPSFVDDPAHVTALRVIAKNGKMTIMLNDAQVKVIRAQVPQGPLQFGIFTETLQWVSAAPPIQIKSFKITDVP